MQSVLAIDPSRITWVIPADVWMFARETDDPTAIERALLQTNGDWIKAADKLEARGCFVRLDPAHRPTRFRFPVIGKDELRLLRAVTDAVRRGRVTSITLTADGQPAMSFGDGQADHVIDAAARDVVFVHCASPGPFNREHVDGHGTGWDRVSERACFSSHHQHARAHARTHM